MTKINSLPYPVASSLEVLRKMKSQARTNTVPEINLRKKLYRKGIRYRINCKPLPELNTKADMIIKKAKLAVFIDGCFWHVCPWHKSFPKSNARWWKQKLMNNRLRDKTSRGILRKKGWRVIRVWTHSNIDAAANKIISTLKRFS